ncbi:MAG: c-type cytochrome [Acidobacteria bacterium]|nr:c-type cytochrome [Acidobacteriota bacterium]
MPTLAAFFVTAALCAQSDDLQRGKRLYEGQCAPCHGQTGTGGRGPNLAQPKLKHGSSEEQLIGVISRGIPGTEMPAAWQMTPREVKQVVVYVQSLGRIAKMDLPGDAARGRALFLGKGGCAACHIVKGAGTALGPELTEIGARRSPEYLREAILDPAKAAPEGYLLVEFTTADGKRITGQRANEDSFTIQILDSGGRYHSFRKSALKELKRLEGHSGMPSYKDKFASSELEDLIAWLASLRGDS